MPPSRKNKRSARGSAEEEISAAKRCNMAQGEADARNEESKEQAEQEKPSLHEIKSMLVDIQITASSIALENKQIKKELADLKLRTKNLAR